MYVNKHFNQPYNKFACPLCIFASIGSTFTGTYRKVTQVHSIMPEGEKYFDRKCNSDPQAL